MGTSWWKSVVLCNYSGVKPDWFWVRDKVKSVCGQLVMKITQEGEAFLCFEDDCAREKVLSLPPLHSWEGTYSFRSWGPMDGILPNHLWKSDVSVTFYGIPLHFRSRQVVEALSKKCGSVFTIDESSINICRGSASVIMKDCLWS
ncbi:hypothetical protein FRX31_032780 [Thalictrum thalictroides]|uniref:DUF4283 domain-containing protein n=1 Tax=Thalictrum thalictroides TaxID=46969 RepID=A0A7J6V037_THATH|nr:hypothetical protein FRX31_032780 [Thalictrum thalictroides]